LETQLLIATNLQYMQQPQQILEQLAEVARLLNGLIKSINDQC
jgi:hypothetical protein